MAKVCGKSSIVGTNLLGHALVIGTEGDLFTRFTFSWATLYIYIYIRLFFYC